MKKAKNKPKTAKAKQVDKLDSMLDMCNVKLDTDIAGMKALLKDYKKLKVVTATEEAAMAMMRSRLKSWDKVKRGVKLIQEGLTNPAF